MLQPALAWANGRFVPAGELTLSFADAGFVSAATVTDFCRTYRHQLFRWPDHLARLRRDCESLRIPLPHTDADLTAAAERLVAEAAVELSPDDDLALITFATPGPLGYMLGLSENGPPTVGMHTFPLPRDRYRRFFAEGVTLAVVGQQPFEGTIVPAGVKHRSRLHWWLAEQAVRDPANPCHCPGAVSVLVGTDSNGADTALGTPLAVVGGTVVRSPRGTVLDGVSVAVVEELCGRLGVPFVEASLNYRVLPTDVSEVMLTGSAFGIAGVKGVVAARSQRKFSWPGPVFRKLLTAWNTLVEMDTERQFLG